MLFLAAAAAKPTQACAVPTSVQIVNDSSVRVSAVFISAPFAGTNQLPATGLAPGETASITLPSCIGIYDVSAVLSDGRRQVQRGVDAQRIRGIVVR